MASRRKLSAKELANLKPMKKGDPCRGPNGRKGNDGKGGVSLKTEFKQWLNATPKADRDGIWFGLMQKAKSGDERAIKLWVELNGEVVNDQQAMIVETLNAIILPNKIIKNENSDEE